MLAESFVTHLSRLPKGVWEQSAPYPHQSLLTGLGPSHLSSETSRCTLVDQETLTICVHSSKSCYEVGVLLHPTTDIYGLVCLREQDTKSIQAI